MSIILSCIAIGIICFTSFEVGHWLSSSALKSKMNYLDNIFIGYLSISSLLSLLYCFTSLRLDIIFLLMAVFAIIFFRYQKNIRHIKFEAPVFVFGLIVCAVVLWPSAANVLEVRKSGGLLLAHTDIFAHASMISQLALQQQIGNSQLLLIGVPSITYHYGVYAIPSIISKYAGSSGLDLMIWFVLPFGMLMLWSSIHGIIKTVTGESYFVSGLLGLLALLIADTSRSVFFDNSLFDLTYLLCASPGAVYGAAIVMVATKIVIQEKKISIPLVAITMIWLAGFRVLFIPVFALFSVFLFLNHVSSVRKSIRLSIILGIVCASVVWGAIGNTALPEYYRFMLTFTEGESTITILNSSYLTQSLQVVVTTLGGSLCVLIVLTTLSGIFKSQYAIRISLIREICIYMLIAYFCTILISPVAPNGDSTEFIQRPFIIVNIVTASLLISILYLHFPWEKLALLSTLVAYTMLITNSRQAGFPVDHAWHINSYKIEVPPDIVNVAGWLNKQSNLSPYLYLPINVGNYGLYPEAIISAISEKPAWLSRPGFYLHTGTQNKSDIENRISWAQGLEKCNINKGADLGRGIYVISESPIPCLSQTAKFNTLYVYYVSS